MKKNVTTPRLVRAGRVSVETRAVIFGTLKEFGSEVLFYPMS